VRSLDAESSGRVPKLDPVRKLCLVCLVAVACFLSPGAVALDLTSAATYSLRSGGDALIVWQGGKTLHESYRTAASAHSRTNAQSITKSISALALFIAAGRGYVDLDAPIPSMSEKKGTSITARDLLNQTSGLNPGYSALYGHRLKNKASTALSLKSLSSPGTAFVYGPSHYEVLETVLAQSLKCDPSGTLRFIQSSLLGPLGIQCGNWQQDAAGRPYFSAGATLNPQEALRLGRLLADGGRRWIFPLVPAKHLEAAALGSKANPAYGMGFWLNKNSLKQDSTEEDVEKAIQGAKTSSQWSRFCLSRQAPSDLIAMVGSGGQRIYVSPSQKLVIVRFGHGSGFEDPIFLKTLFASAR